LYIFASLNFSIASQIFANSLSSSSHLASFQLSISIADAIILSVNCSLLISREKIATFFQLNQTFCAKFNANAVFHIEGLAATITTSHHFKPQHLSSRLLNHNCSLCDFINSGFSCISANSSYL
jgi:hypothetical protein